MRRQLVWEWTRGSGGLEQCLARRTASGVELEGMVVADLERQWITLRYRIRCDTGWQFVHADVTSLVDGRERRLTIERDGNANWRIDGQPRSDLGGCDEIDLMASPVTNSLPIRRMDLAPAQVARCNVAWITNDDLRVLRASQEYRYGEASLDGTRSVGYHSLNTGFRADLSVDAEGFVIDYPPYWRRPRFPPLGTHEAEADAGDPDFLRRRES